MGVVKQAELTKEMMDTKIARAMPPVYVVHHQQQDLNQHPSQNDSRSDLSSISDLLTDQESVKPKVVSHVLDFMEANAGFQEERKVS